MNRLQRYLEERMDAIGAWRECRFDSWTRKQRVLFAVAHPKPWSRWVKHCFAARGTLPGDVWEDFQRDTCYLVRVVRSDEVLVVPVSGQARHAGWVDPVMTVESFDRDAMRSRWVRVDEQRATEIRELVARTL